MPENALARFLAVSVYVEHPVVQLEGEKQSETGERICRKHGNGRRFLLLIKNSKLLLFPRPVSLWRTKEKLQKKAKLEAINLGSPILQKN